VLANWIDDFLYMKRETDWGILPTLSIRS